MPTFKEWLTAMGNAMIWMTSGAILVFFALGLILFSIKIFRWIF